MAFVKEAEEETSNTSSKNSIEDDSIEKLPIPMMVEYRIELRIDEKINSEPTIVVGNKKLNFYKQQIMWVAFFLTKIVIYSVFMAFLGFLTVI